jgi:uncharacterized protein YndB with AHSA1/START domain
MQSLKEIAMTAIHHGTFTIERSYKAPRALVFKAFEDIDAKRRWFVQGDDENWQVESFETDFRVGGSERSRFRYAGGPLISNDTVYLDIAANERIIIAYTMGTEGSIFSSSMSTIRFEPHGSGTKLIYTEQGAYFGEANQILGREEGTKGLFESLAKELDRLAAAA